MDMPVYRLPVVIEKDGSGYVARCPDLRGCLAQERTYEEALANVQDAIRLHIEDRLATGESIPQPAHVSVTTVDVAV